jgi:2,3-bisphosphoglycerate-dependent phosphoglycerate mutase
MEYPIFSGDMCTLVYLIRHGETLWNKEKRLQGQLDSPLTHEGIRQARVLAGRLSSVQFDAVYSSDLERARHTAKILTSRSDKVAVTFDERIRERHFGCFQGLTWEEITKKFPEEAAKERLGNPMNLAPGGESKQQLLSRAQAFFKDIALRHANQKILVISHGGILNVWTRQVLNIPMDTPRRFHLYNTAINIFEYYDHKWYLKTLGENP